MVNGSHDFDVSLQPWESQLDGHGSRSGFQWLSTNSTQAFIASVACLYFFDKPG